MAADNISNLVDPSVFPELDKLVNRLVDVESEITTINGKSIQLTVDLKGADNLQRLIELTQQQQAMTDKLTATTQDYVSIANQATQAQNQINTATGGNVRLLVEQKQELSYVNEQIKILNRDLAAGAGNYERNIALLTTYTQRQIALKQEISANSSALKDMTVNINQTNNAFTIMGINVEGIFARMAIRMIAMQVAILPAIAAVGALAENFTKLSASEQAAKDKLDEYNDALKETAKLSVTAEGTISGGQAFDVAKGEAAAQIANDVTKSIEKRVLAYQDLQSAIPNVFKSLTDEQKKTGDFVVDLDKLNNAARVQNELKEAALVLKSKDDALAKNRAILPQLEKDYGESLDPNNSKNFNVTGYKNAFTQGQVDQIRLSKEQTAAQKEFKRAYAEMNALQVLDEKEKKQKKAKDPLNEMQQQLATEKEIYERRLAENKNYFESTKKTYADEEKLNADNIAAAKDYGQHSFEILAYWVKQKKANYNQYQKDLEAIQKDLLNADNKYSEEEKKILDKILADRKEAENQIAALLEQELTLQEKAQKLEDAKKSSSDHTAYAKSFAPFLEGLTGGDNSLSDQLKEFDTSIKQKKQELKDAEIELANANRDGNEKDITKYSNKKSTANDSIAQLEIDRQKAIDDKIIEGKKQLAEKTVEFAKQAFDAIKTINDNEIAVEQQNLEIRAKMLQLQYQQKVDAINASAGYAIDKENQLSRLAAQNKAQQDAIQQQSNQLALKKARGDKEAAELGIVANTAKAIIEVFAAYSDIPGGIAIAAGLAGVLAATGAAQYAAVASTPLPQFWKGGETSTPFFIAGEKGAELMTTPTGETMMADKPGIYSAPIGTKINTAAETAALMRFASNNIGLHVNGMGELKEKRETMTDKGIIAKLDEVIESNMYVARMQRTIKNNVTVNLSNDLQRF